MHRTVAFAVLAISGCLVLGGCAAPQSESVQPAFAMGERAPAIPFVYTVMDTEWLDQLGEAPAQRLPEHRFLAIRLTVTNGGVATTAVPLMTLLDSQNRSYPELTDAPGLDEWLGFVRMLPPAETERGRVLFDVPTGAYRLRVTNGDPDNPNFALVDIPVQFGPADDIRPGHDATK
ncbi:MAG: DUF4352 domain-containing protein [Bryobacteraceae bacterium]